MVYGHCKNIYLKNLQTAITNDKNGSNEVEKKTSETKTTKKVGESSSEFSPGEEDWPNGFPLLRMALLGLPRPKSYGVSIRRKLPPSTDASSVGRANESNSKKPPCAEEVKSVLLKETQEPEDCKTLPDWEDEAAEADSFSDTIYPALLCSPDLHSPTSQDSPHLNCGGTGQDGTWSCIKADEPALLGSDVEEGLEHCRLKFVDKNRWFSLQRHCKCKHEIKDEASHCKSNDSVITTTDNISYYSKTCKCNEVFFLNGVQHNLPSRKQFSCSKCGKFFKQQRNLLKHSKRHCGKKLNSDDNVPKASTTVKLMCDICDRKFTTNQHLKNHVLSHSGIRPYQCDLCECSFIYKSHVARHRLIHTNERHYTCDYCSYSFIQKSNFYLHLRTRACLPTPAAKRVCNLCNKEFSKKMYLESHLQKHASIFISTE